jgi:uncharacterized protein YjbI with pentapeptide repeats
VPHLDLSPDEYYDGLEVADDELSGQDASGARFADCTFRSTRLDGVTLTGARFDGCVLERLAATTLDLSRGDWTDVTVTDPRWGGAQAFAVDWRRVTLTGGKIDYLNLRDAVLSGVVLDGVTVGELDLSGVRATGLVLRDVVVRELVTDRARLGDADLTGLDTAALRSVRGLAGLRGARITDAQLVDLAPALAAHVGLVVSDAPPAAAR